MPIHANKIGKIGMSKNVRNPGFCPPLKKGSAAGRMAGARDSLRILADTHAAAKGLSLLICRLLRPGLGLRLIPLAEGLEEGIPAALPGGLRCLEDVPAALLGRSRRAAARG
jgi:hypothetical protein